jgi:hypothetical protein
MTENEIIITRSVGRGVRPVFPSRLILASKYREVPVDGDRRPGSGRLVKDMAQIS